MEKIIKGIEGNDFVIRADDKAGIKFAMLFEAHCTIGKNEAINKYEFSEQWYYKLLKKYKTQGTMGLIDKKKGPAKQPVRTKEVINQVIRHRYLDSGLGADIIAQKMNQNGYKVSIRSIERIITEYGLQKKRIS